MEEHVIQPFHSLFPALDALQLIQTLCGLVAQQQVKVPMPIFR